MSDEFKKLDDWMMDAARRERETRVPEKELQDFHNGVMKKILEKQHHGVGIPYIGFAMVGALCFAVILGAVFYIQSVKVEKVTPVVENAPSLMSSPEVSVGDLKPKGLPTAPMLSETSLVDEIEALKELGVWTEEDEQEAGIPVEVTFGDLEVGINLQPAIPPAAVQS